MCQLKIIKIKFCAETAVWSRISPSLICPYNLPISLSLSHTHMYIHVHTHTFKIPLKLHKGVYTTNLLVSALPRHGLLHWNPALWMLTQKHSDLGLLTYWKLNILQCSLKDNQLDVIHRNALVFRAVRTLWLIDLFVIHTDKGPRYNVKLSTHLHVFHVFSCHAITIPNRFFTKLQCIKHK